MSKAGQNNFKGINSQSLSALSLFLQNINKTNFKEMILEGDKLEDFVLVYTDGKKIICESKERKKGVHLKELKDILTVVSNNNQLKKQDELLIISNKIDDKVKSLVNNFVFWDEKSLEKLKIQRPKFEDKHLQMIPQVKLWEVSQKINKNGVIFLMYQILSGNNPFWVSKDQLEDWTKSILIDDIYHNSQNGKTITKEEFLKKIEDKKQSFLENNGVSYVDIKKMSLKKIEEIVELVSKNNPTSIDLYANKISRLIANPVLHYELLRRLNLSENIVLDNWDNLWMASVNSYYSFEVYKIFQKNLLLKSNQEYIISFTNLVLDDYLINHTREDFIKNDISSTLSRILETSPEYTEQVIKTLQKLFKYHSGVFFQEEKHQDKSWGKEQVAESIKKIYELKNISKKTKKSILKFIFKSFNLTEDEGKYWHHTPPVIFSIVCAYINEEPKKRLAEFIDIISKQYQQSIRRYSKKTVFDGWEHFGSGISQSGDEFSIEDRNFVTQILQPALNTIKNSNDKWKFIVNNWITTDQNKISSNNPDYLNRAAIPYLIFIYNKGKHSRKAFEILSAFIKSRRGIPWKPDIIFQELKKNEMPVEKKWALIKVSLDEYKNIPVNVFVEQIVTEIAQNSDDEYQKIAIATIKSWAKSDEYREKRSLGSYDVIDSVFSFLKNPKTINQGIQIFSAYLKKMSKTNNTFDSWDAGRALSLIISKSPTKGINLLKNIEKKSKLSISEQIILFSSISDIPVENKDILVRIYDELVDQILKKHSNAKLFQKKYFHSGSRENLVTYAENLAKINEFEKSLIILKFFIKDTDPELNETYGDENGISLHTRVVNSEDCNVIESVRGRVSWALRYFSILHARNYFKDGFDLLEKLVNDNNYYIRLQSTYALSDFVKNKDTYLPNTEPKEPFADAELSRRIEKFVFKMIENPINQKLPAVMKGMIHVFSMMRQINSKQAYKIMTIFLNCGYEDVLGDASSLLLFFAEFRKNSFKKWIWRKLPVFDDTDFKVLLNNQIKNGNSEVKKSLSWEFWRLPTEGVKESEKYNKSNFDISLNYLKLFTNAEYDKDIWENIYHFIEDYIDYEFEPCYELWKSCLEKEKPYLTEATKDKEKFYDLYWRPFFYNGKILIKILENKGEQDFLKWLDFLLDYPDGIIIGNDIDDAVIKLSNFSRENQTVKAVFEKIVTRFPKHWDLRNNWENSISK